MSDEGKKSNSFIIGYWPFDFSDESYLNSQRKLNQERREDYKKRLKRLRFNNFIIFIAALGFGIGHFLCVYLALENHINYFFILLIIILGGFFVGNIVGMLLWENNELIEELKSKLNYCIKCCGKGTIGAYNGENEPLDSIRCPVCNPEKESENNPQKA